ncbi:cytochrome c biogenesis heme-transporting ATPase CcmA [Halomonas denitrificans]|uniref:cytochrome c biogenesis heme-transporting ATPase CcmA n=1 Tax=Halomonas TaxID=2745 RepID=UPI001C988F13|nr:MULTISPECIES: cytochrome c biogenesis heme-transporting ATPase CcmA [Halomonas]MBY5927877.1 cytochrome c biogenesis heme-transporting ATPase CcmA [Halomonas sp. DP8Y7-3]MCA0976040.1 cytochrome c biogenesis heme-transporting ATPase CcmA [Halomonas denitrificans]
MRLCLEARQLACERDGRWLFHGLDLILGAGDVLRIEGPNGSGKTTLLKVLCGQISDVEGQVLWDGRALSKARADLLANLLYLGHAPGIKAHLTAMENLRWYQALAGRRCSDRELGAALAEVGLAGFEDVGASQLSAGQQRRVTLARLVLSRHPLWILDEPFTAIDVDGVSALEQRLVEHAGRGGAVLVTTHHALANVPGLRRLSLSGPAREVA